MGRRKANLFDLFSDKVSPTSKITASVIFFIMSIIGIVIFAKEVPEIIFVPILFIIFSVVLFFVGIMQIPKNKDINEEEDEEIECEKETPITHSFNIEDSLFSQDAIDYYKQKELNRIKQWYQNLTEQYSLSSVDFNEKTLSAKITFNITKKYRTIERYVQQDYVRSPVYSNWKYKHSSLTKTLKITNETLEELNNNQEKLIRDFSSLIIVKLCNKNYPSWFVENVMLTKMSTFTTEKYIDNEKLSNEITNQKNITKNEIKAFADKIDKINEKISSIDTKRLKKQKKLNKRLAKNLLFTSKRRYNKLNGKIKNLENEIELLNNEINSNKTAIDERSLYLENFTKETKDKIKENNRFVYMVRNKFSKEKESIKKLSKNIEETEDFIPLKDTNYMTYEKIVGCYIIKNNENNRFYVGQSKDILRRLKQHFTGTEPKNIIFAEDYFKSKLENKQDLFSVKIIKLTTKDELDREEKSLIELYEARTKGYNGTLGNS